MATCPECDADIEIDDDDLQEMEAGDPWDCDACGSHLRVVSLDPMEFEADEEDDDEDEEEEEEGAEDKEASDDELGDFDDADDEEEEWEE